MELKNHLKKNLKWYLAAGIFASYIGTRQYLVRPEGKLYQNARERLERLVDHEGDGFDYRNEIELKLNLRLGKEEKPSYSDLKEAISFYEYYYEKIKKDKS